MERCSTQSTRKRFALHRPIKLLLQFNIKSDRQDKETLSPLSEIVLDVIEEDAPSSSTSILDDQDSQFDSLPQEIKAVSTNHTSAPSLETIGSISSDPDNNSQLLTSTTCEEVNFLNHFKEVITKRILQSDESPIPITIQGSKGLGKKTLANKIYHSYEVRRRFQRFAWISMPSNSCFRPINLGRSIILQLAPYMKKRQVMNMLELEVMEELHRLQQEQRCLIVLCDVKDDENWRRLRMGLVVGDKSKTQVLITTSTCHISLLMERTTTYPSYGITPLDDGQMIKHFQGITPDCISEVPSNPQTSELKRLIRACNGSILAMAILSGYLNHSGRLSSDSVNDTTKEDQTSETNGEQVDEKVGKAVQRMLYFSYTKLPYPQLQHCFLYLGHYPEDYNILTEDLYNHWIDESLISSSFQTRTTADTSESPSSIPTQTTGDAYVSSSFQTQIMGDTNDNQPKDLMDVAKHYLEILIKRNLVQLVEMDRGSSGIVTSCNLHPLVRDFCICQGKKEGLYTLDVPSTTEKFQKLSVINSSCFVFPPKSNSCLRSISFFNSSVVPSNARKKFGDLIRNLEILKFYGVDFNAWCQMNTIGKLIKLRHLNFNECYMKSFPPSIGDLSMLETLDLRVQRHCTVSIPNVLNKLSNLRRLYLPQRYVCADRHDAKMNLNRLKKLDTLVNFNARICDVSHLTEMSMIENITAIVKEDHHALDDILSFMKSVFARLRCSSLDVRNFNCYSETKKSILTKLLTSDELSGKLRLDGIIEQLPDDVIKVCPNLTEIKLLGSELEEDPMSILGKIPKLRSLTLCDDAYVGKELECRESGFPELRYLKIKSLRQLEKWIVNGGSMSKLVHLSIGKCVRLSMLPDGLKSLNALRELKILSMPEEFKTRLQVVNGKLGEDVPKIQQVFTINILP